jgi:predicted alpha/beta superfamily hydrolase
MIEIHSQFYSPQLNNSRRIWVWLPDNYEKDEDTRYPVLYMHDGQNVFDPATSFSGVSWNVDGTLKKMVKSGKSREVIIVALDSNDDRESEYDFMERGEQYADFIVQTVKPFIDSEYRTESDRDNTALMGSSLGALISIEVMWKYPQIFSKIAGLSLPAFYNDDSIFSIVTRETKPEEKLKIYFDHGTRGQDRWYGRSAREFCRHLLKCGIPESDVTYKVFRNADHTEADWAKRVKIPLAFLFGSGAKVVSPRRLGYRNLLRRSAAAE